MRRDAPGLTVTSFRPVCRRGLRAIRTITAPGPGRLSTARSWFLVVASCNEANEIAWQVARDWRPLTVRLSKRRLGPSPQDLRLRDRRLPELARNRHAAAATVGPLLRDEPTLLRRGPKSESDLMRTCAGDLQFPDSTPYAMSRRAMLPAALAWSHMRRASSSHFSVERRLGRRLPARSSRRRRLSVS